MSNLGGLILGLLPLLLSVHLVFLAFGINLLPGWITGRASLVLACAVVAMSGFGPY